MHNQVLALAAKDIIDPSFLGLDSTPVAANTFLNNHKAFLKTRFSKSKPPKSDPDCALGVHTASNCSSEKNFEFYWGYKNHVLVDCISGLPIYELTTGANIHDSSVATEILKNTNEFLPLTGCTFIADKGYDTKVIYNTVKDVYQGDCVIPLNKRGTKSRILIDGRLRCEAGLLMHKDGTSSDHGRKRQKFICPFARSKSKSCPVDHPHFFNGKKCHGCINWITIPDDYRLQIDRHSSYFKATYSLRTECERYNSRFKNSGQERAWVRNGDSVANLNTLAHISMLAIAIAAVATNKRQAYRKLKTLKRAA